MLKSTRNFYILLSLAIIGLLMLLIPFIILTFFTDENIQKKEENKEKEEGQEQKKLILLFIDKYPDKMKYKEGEIFDDTGLILKAYYDDNTSPQIFDYTIDNKSPLTIYNTKISFSFREKTSSLYIEIINSDNIKIIPNPSSLKYTLEPTKDVITRFEIEEADLNDWIIYNDDNNYPQNNIIERNDASRNYFLSGLEKDVLYESKLIFYINLQFDAKIEISVSYSQKEEFKNEEYYMPLIYSFIADDKNNIEINNDNQYLNKRDDITKWQLIKYKAFNLLKGEHNITLKVLEDREKGTPNIDYINFKTEESKEIIDIPSNDFHTLLQYQYILEPDPNLIYKYASGNIEISKPIGNILDFSDSIKDSSESYIIEISEFKNFSISYKINNLKEKKYTLINLKLSQNIFYRGEKQENEQNLINAKIYELTVNDKPPRNLDVPGISNMRDIGGYKTYLIKNGIIKQGLYFRCAQINHVTTEGKKILTEKLGIKIEIDLRESSKNTGPYVDGIEYHPIPIPPHTEYKRFEKFEEEYYKVFTLISQADKNPIILHCVQGADRTGIMTFALLILLGCDYNDVAKDYLFTNFSKQGYRRLSSEFNIWWEKLNNYEGDTKAEQCKNWLMTKGLEEEKLEHIRAIFIDGYQE